MLTSNGSKPSAEFDPEKIYHRLMETGGDWADKEAAADLLEETKKVVLAEMTMRYAADSKSQAQAESRGLISKEYREHITTMNAARRAANRAKVAYDSIKALMELRRSQESTRRAEAQIR